MELPLLVDIKHNNLDKSDESESVIVLLVFIYLHDFITKICPSSLEFIHKQYKLCEIPLLSFASDLLKQMNE